MAKKSKQESKIEALKKMEEAKASIEFAITSMESAKLDSSTLQDVLCDLVSEMQDLGEELYGEEYEVVV